MRRYLLVLDMDLLAMDEEQGLKPISYLVARQEQEPCDVVVLSLVATQPKMPVVILAGSGIPPHPSLASRPGLSADAEHRMNQAVRHLTTIGCRASRIISSDDLVAAVRSETAVAVTTR